MAHVAEWKKKEVEELANLIKSYPVVALVDVSSMPAYPLSQMRRLIRENNGLLRVSRNTLIELAIKKVAQELGKPELEKLINYIEGGAGILVTTMNPFKLYKFLQQNRQPAPAKPGAKVPKDVVIPAGPTSLAPGPIVGQMQAMGIPARIERGKVTIQKDTVVLKAGEEITPELANILNALGIQPLEVGLDLLAVYEDGIIYTPDVLAIDESEYINMLQKAYMHAFNLAVNIAYPTPQTIEAIIQKAFLNAKAVAVEAGYITKETISDIIGRAIRAMLLLAQQLPEDVLDEKTKELLSAQAQVSVAQVEEEKKEEKVEEEKEDEEASEEEALAGLSALFG
ncbi:50S ribosomal protein L10 [Pyrococcus furiosus DSM 3638]|uniref:Large ribosomal subunit protein uL10 n=3 Tax=Pyrococcus furiosus TaxID=2261 RepID=RL10_PYRFU|nr:50S ribosomal protein L10 [Pyrococcus furiosus]Q8TZJ8.1 RecName: Full=Large ribosomal subunit protein uL10; AltName: Full=50S ribosomal protein L10; AltName: Full=Acidic ribosomal protein P0 homolog [Pyrococcus furiosus DSM 3638]4V6U_Bk Chain Bk, Acidic ribosomal protein P0 homolog [Pyrococcus furiosus DSM 3638]AAL82117.1 LSU ribosomal protein L10E [Pyrococcus furiosus DSM 3638]AFN04650.1 acidic ribosomal protein P0 [Pyrococcus furiosus COM1]QEK79586.1 50S ribosomal protein L10 [Pyrococcus 